MADKIVILAIDPGLANTGLALGTLDLETGARVLLHTELFHTAPKTRADIRFKEHALRARWLWETTYDVYDINEVRDSHSWIPTHLIYEWPQKNKLPAVCLGVWVGAFPECEQWGVAPRTWQAAMFKGLPGNDTKVNSRLRALIDWGKTADGSSDHVHDAMNMLTWYMDKLYLESLDPKFLEQTQGKLDSMRRVTGVRRKV